MMPEPHKPLNLEPIRVVFSAEPFQFALQYDHNAAHVTGSANEILPRRTVSGLWLQAVVLDRLVHHEAYSRLLCASSLATHWLKPVVDGDEVELHARYTDRARPDGLRRDTEVDGYVKGERVFTIRVAQLLSQENKHDRSEASSRIPEQEVRSPGASAPA